jgi:dolichyl-phosphate-mannose-protein mannosyltransferase
MSTSPNNTLRQRGPKDQSKANGKVQDELDKIVESTKQSVTSEWDYKLALAIITLLSFATRFFGISHPNEVVFDEVHFGKVSQTPSAR